MTSRKDPIFSKSSRAQRKSKRAKKTAKVSEAPIDSYLSKISKPIHEKTD